MAPGTNIYTSKTVGDLVDYLSHYDRTTPVHCDNKPQVCSYLYREGITGQYWIELQGDDPWEGEDA